MIHINHQPNAKLQDKIRYNWEYLANDYTYEDTKCDTSWLNSMEVDGYDYGNANIDHTFYTNYANSTNDHYVHNHIMENTIVKCDVNHNDKCDTNVNNTHDYNNTCDHNLNFTTNYDNSDNKCNKHFNKNNNRTHSHSHINTNIKRAKSRHKLNSNHNDPNLTLMTQAIMQLKLDKRDSTNKYHRPYNHNRLNNHYRQSTQSNHKISHNKNNIIIKKSHRRKCYKHALCIR